MIVPIHEGKKRCWHVLLLLVAIFLTSCVRSYPYLITNQGCNCEQYTYRDTRRNINIRVQAGYKVRDRIQSEIEIVFFNESQDTLDLSLGFIKGTSQNVRYQYNGKSLPLPYVKIQPGDDYSITLRGDDTETVDDPWHKVAGERVVVEITRLMLGGKMLPPISFSFVPLNPKFSRKE